MTDVNVNLQAMCNTILQALRDANDDPAFYRHNLLYAYDQVVILARGYSHLARGYSHLEDCRDGIHTALVADCASNAASWTDFAINGLHYFARINGLSLTKGV